MHAPTMPHTTETSSYRRMLKATSAIAGARAFTIVISIIRSKVLAMLLGPSGMGVINLVTASTEFTRVITGMGLDGATVRRIVEASSGDDSHALERAYRVAARTAIGIGIVAWTGISIASPWLSQGAFSTTSKYWLFIIGGASLVSTPLLGVQLAFLQGLRLIKMLGVCQIITSLFGAIITIGAVYIFGAYGGVFVLAPISIASLFIHRRFVSKHRRGSAEPIKINYGKEIISNLKIGSGFAINAIWLTTSGWLNLLFLRQHYGDQGIYFVGLYTAASTLANFYASLVLSALSTEFYPALSSVADDPVAMRKMLNQQTVLSIAVGVPCTLGALVAAPYLLQILYSSKFVGSSDLMRCLLAGMAVRFVTCPLGYILLARRATRAFFWSELMVGITMISTSLLMLWQFGLIGLGIALVVTNLLHLVGLAVVANGMNIYWSRKTSGVIAETLVVLGLCLYISLKFDHFQDVLWCGLLLIGYGTHIFSIISKESGLSMAGFFHKLRNRS